MLSIHDVKKSLLEVRRSDVCIVIGNGPSLKNVPEDFLNQYTTFGANRIYLRYTPTFLSVVNPLVMEQFGEEIDDFPGVKFITEKHAYQMKNVVPLNSLALPHFSKNPAHGVYEGFTVTYVNLQLAYFFEYKTVLLVGVDHRFVFDGAPNEEKVSQTDDPNHFSADYFGKGVRWNNPDLEGSARAYQMAKTVYEADGRKIINLTEGSALDVFHKGKIGDWYEQ